MLLAGLSYVVATALILPADVFGQTDTGQTETGPKNAPPTESSVLATDWLTGEPFLRGLNEPASIEWQQTPIRDGLVRLAHSHRIAIFLDRNLDPDRRIDISVQAKPLRELLRTIAQQAGGDIGYVGPVVYIGPAFTCQRIATLAEMQNQRMASKLPDRHRKLLQPSTLQWEVLAEPRQLVLARLQYANLTSRNLDVIPHDVWPAYELPPMTWAEQMTLLLAGFRLSFILTPDGKEVRWTEFPKAVALRREYPARGDAAKIVAELQQEMPQAFVEVEKDAIVVRSTLEDHWILEERFLNKRSQPSPDTRDAEKSRFTLTVKNQPIRPVLETVAKKLNRQLAIDDHVELDDQTRTSFAVTDATELELLQAIVQQAELTVELDDTTIRISKPNASSGN